MVDGRIEAMKAEGEAMTDDEARSKIAELRSHLYAAGLVAGELSRAGFEVSAGLETSNVQTIGDRDPVYLYTPSCEVKRRIV